MDGFRRDACILYAIFLPDGQGERSLLLPRSQGFAPSTGTGNGRAGERRLFLSGTMNARTPAGEIIVGRGGAGWDLVHPGVRWRPARPYGAQPWRRVRAVQGSGPRSQEVPDPALVVEDRRNAPRRGRNEEGGGGLRRPGVRRLPENAILSDKGDQLHLGQQTPERGIPSQRVHFERGDGGRRIGRWEGRYVGG